MKGLQKGGMAELLIGPFVTACVILWKKSRSILRDREHKREVNRVRTDVETLRSIAKERIQRHHGILQDSGISRHLLCFNSKGFQPGRSLKMRGMKLKGFIKIKVSIRRLRDRELIGYKIR